ncbi:[FeFe] hydrogenase H-cluster maturation GTPase HydF [Hypnocyclicus thermotrophus]|uniref:[FeFe] hydrogenase H-cluster maturation GTPase HydF n=1 Tax=Hypnocyclicus thermotrophus TaxID=1627895 RepID=A0AA46I5G2_9FUSO|nr:[FeFe] hydrogenase H-cluster maturation GTPase HydF [Hypnocyclicus thermotrophus]TDT68054.1 [FeFe] hydrogenase H-cluster maturation GTPase HydF [Hypnocyclicus thermotrophus]
MSNLNKTPTANRLHIAIFGKRNMGKSTLINALTNQNIAIVSDFAGTTTDPVSKAMEILPIGPCVIIDTAGIDDVGELGNLRIQKSIDVIKKTDIALLVIDYNGFNNFDYKIMELLKENNTKFIVVVNKTDIQSISNEFKTDLNNYKYIELSAKNKTKINELKELIIKHSPKSFEQPSILGDLISPGDDIILVIPIDTGMPKGRLILPQVQTIRDILDNDGIIHISKERELRWTLENLKKKPKLVITDSQEFAKVSADTPDDILLTSFSILFARYKGDLFELVKGAKVLKNLKPNDKVLIAEACTHHAQPDDIGKVKIPRWIKQNIEPEIEFDFCSGRDYPNNLTNYKLVIHCGGCTLNRKEMLNRIEASTKNGVPIINYGLCIATIHGILDRALKPFEEVYLEWLDSE